MISDKGKILAALDRLEAGGSTAGGEGIALAYSLAEADMDPEAVNRVILATDGDFNVGIREPEVLHDFVELPALVFSDDVATRIVPPRYGDSSGVRGAAWLWPAGSAPAGQDSSG